ncbi:MAG TPA: WYL domain-containing protein [Sphaerochaeta sp.]|nr:WYL domain-containing protein [Sphaerochaeta sp.]
MSQIERIFYINRKILEDGKVSTAQVVSAFEISKRQVMRDIDYLRDTLQAPLVYEAREKGYVYTGDFSMMSNSNERVLVLNAIFRSLAESQGALSVITDMVSEGLDSGLEESYKSLSDKIIFITPVQDWPDYSIFNKICSAMKGGQRMTLRYRNAKGERSVRHIEPLRLVNYSGRWYLLSFDRQNRELRTFHLSRIEQIEGIEGDFFTSRYSDEELDSFIHGGFGIFMGNKSIPVTFCVFGWARNALETQTWHKDQKIRKVELDGKEGLEVTVPVANLEEILSQLLAFGPLARPVGPPQFVQAWKAAVMAMAEEAGKI